MPGQAKHIEDVVEQFSDRLLENTRDALRETAPRRTGRLANSFRREGKDKVVSAVPYAVAVDEQRPYIDRSIDRGVDKTVKDFS